MCFKFGFLGLSWNFPGQSFLTVCMSACVCVGRGGRRGDGGHGDGGGGSGFKAF